MTCTCLHKLERIMLERGENTVTFWAIRAAMNAAPQTSGLAEARLKTYVPTEELARLRAWEKWGRTHAKAGLDATSLFYNAPQFVKDALAAMPKDEREGM